jgi:hypothetical protein
MGEPNPAPEIARSRRTELEARLLKAAAYRGAAFEVERRQEVNAIQRELNGLDAALIESDTTEA